MSRTPEYVAEATKIALEQFWSNIAIAFPEATGGDLEPEVISHFEEVALAAVKRWVHWNVEGN